MAALLDRRAVSILAACWDGKGSLSWGMAAGGGGSSHGFSETNPARARVPRVAFAQGIISSGRLT